MSIILHCFDDTPSEPHGELGPNHCATIGSGGTIEYEYQAKMWVEEVEREYPQVVRIECPALNRTWVRENGKFRERE